jgi:CheY-like chemotaxis protein
MPDSARPRVLVVDDHPGIRLRIVAALADTCEVVGAAEDGREALTAVELLKPDVVILDLSIPVMNGLEVAAQLRRGGSTVRIVFYTAHGDEEFRQAAKNAGASAYVLKPRLDELVSAVNSAGPLSPVRERIASDPPICEKESKPGDETS